MDLNCDMGESYGAYQMGADQEVMPHITSANIACGWHAGDPMVMDQTIQLAVSHQVNIGAHPGYPDLMGFGRRPMHLSPLEIRNYIIYQLGALQAFCAVHHTRVSHVKPHGSLYLKAVESVEIARSIAEGIVRVNPQIAFIALAGEKGRLMAKVGKEFGLRVIYEAFPDRAYTPDGNLAPRSMEGAVKHDPAEIAERALMMAEEGRIVDTKGQAIEIQAETLCLHGDTAQAGSLAKTIRQSLEKAGIRVKPAMEQQG
ncbi:LamB/YcsF family protein [Desulfogranum mediterraneum]|uniref:LamB/YcsF family protein n=1 Tax=Desulfogranum mediterraneum TaxID=160661 RepID=UPI00048F4C56